MNWKMRETKFAAVIFIIGFIMMFLVPTWQIPDEYTHLQIIGDSIHNEDFAPNLEQSMEIERGRVERNYSEKVDFDELKKAMVKTPEYTRKEMLPRGLDFSIIKHFPSVIGLYIGILIGLPAFWVLQLGELASLIFYTFVCYNGLKLLPIKKEMMFMTMIIPEMLQQAGSLSYDSVILPVCMFYICYILYLKFVKSKIGLKELLLSVLLPVLICYLKMPYVMLTLLIFLLPLNKIEIQLGKLKIDEDTIRKWRIPAIVVIVILFILAVYLLRNNAWINLVFAMILEWKQSLYLLYQTVKTWGSFLAISSVGNFGWLDTPISLLFCIFIYVAILMVSFVNSDKVNQYKLNGWDRTIIIVTLLLLVLLTTISLVNHTITIILYGVETAPGTYDIRTALYQIPYIGGLQGRYFLPFISLLFMWIPQMKRVTSNVIKIGIISFETLTFIYIFYVLIARYWIG